LFFYNGYYLISGIFQELFEQLTLKNITYHEIHDKCFVFNVKSKCFIIDTIILHTNFIKFKNNILITHGSIVVKPLV